MVLAALADPAVPRAQFSAAVAAAWATQKTAIAEVETLQPYPPADALVQLVSTQGPELLLPLGRARLRACRARAVEP